ncbi:MAG: ABC transporter permease [Clostridia bacterium]|nr:ABC transporter permease [Clostridia bacterium]
MLITLGNSAQAAVYEKLGSIGLNGIVVFAGDHTGLGADDGEAIVENIPGVEAYMPFDFRFSYYSIHTGSDLPCMIVGADSNVDEYMSLEIVSGRCFTSEECNTGQAVCFVEEKLAETQFGHINISGETLNLIIDGSELEFTVVGVCRSSLESLTGLLGYEIPPFIYVPWSSLGSDESTDVSQLALKLDGRIDGGEAALSVKKYLTYTEKNGRYYDVEDMNAYRNEFSSVVELITLVLALTAGISLFVAVLGVMSSMLSGVNERKGEIGVCKAIGATSSDICLMFLSESLAVTALGCVLGTLVGVAVSFTMFYVLFESLPVITIGAIAVPFVITAFAGLMAGVIPAVSAAKLSPVIAIRKD